MFTDVYEPFFKHTIVDGKKLAGTRQEIHQSLLDAVDPGVTGDRSNPVPQILIVDTTIPLHGGFETMPSRTTGP